MDTRYFRIGATFVLTSWLLVGSAAATASSALPDYTTVTSCLSGQLGLAGGTTSCSQADGNGSDDLTLTVLPFAGLSANAAVGAVLDDHFSGFGVLNYSFEVVGGTAGDHVPLLISTNLFTSNAGGGDGYAFSEILVSTALVSNLGEVTCTATNTVCPGPVPANFSGILSVEATSGSIDTVGLEIEVSASAQIYSDGDVAGASAFASADPLIYVDPGFAGAGDYSILLSDGVGNATASSPEPGTLILICCCGPFLFFARRYLRPA